MNYAFITVDVEGPKGEGYDADNPINSFIWCKNSNGTYGIDLIMDLCELYKTKGLFFIDIAEAWDYSETEISCVVKHVAERGHSVGVHIHPNHMFDEKRLFLYEYSRAEQFEMIKKCTELYTRILGTSPKYFRAGKYGANYDTLDILIELGYGYDFSEFYGQKWCGIIPPLTKNSPCRYKSLIEIPVTVFNSLKLFGKKRYDKLDLNMVEYWHNYVIRRINEDNNYLISLFLHSFSFIQWRKEPNNPPFDIREYKKIKRELDVILSSKNITLISPNELEELLIQKELDILDNFESEVSFNFYHSYWYLLCTSVRIYKTNVKALLFLLCNIGMLLFLLSECFIF